MELSQIERTWTFTHEGKKWTLPRPTIKDVDLKYEDYLQQQVKDRIDKNYDPNSRGYKVATEVFLDSCDKGKYRWASDHFWETVYDAENATYLLWLWFFQVDKEMTVERIREMWVDSFKELTVMLKEMLDDPNLSMPSFCKAAKSRIGARSSKSSNESPSTKPASTS